MRFLQAALDGTLTLTEDLTQPPGRYAILSHTWGEDEHEVSFDDIVKKTGHHKAGYNKLRFCVNQAEVDGLQYCWVDTCCINKANLSELDEAIRSMFSWYRAAAKCYVYLNDVFLHVNGNTNNKNRGWEQAFRNSRWFKRGWTLQELLAPTSVHFYSQEGEKLGTKDSLQQQIHEITKIPVAALKGTPLSHFGPDEKLQWTSKRQTKKPEDRAYCLLGIFGVFMPLMYGEGDNAFERLTSEIYNKTNLSGLKVVDGAAYDAYGQVHTCCHPDTRRELLQEIYAWTKQADAPPIFWLSGMAGTGKSTISQTVAEYLATTDRQSNASLGASFFFKRGEGDRGSAALLFPTIVYQLATRIDGYRELVAQAIRDDDQICSKALGEQFKRLLDLPFRRLAQPSAYRHYIVVVDALDECDKEEDMRAILQLWSAWSTMASVRLRLFITSRPEVPIQLGFDNLSNRHQPLILHEVPRPVMQHDIFVYLEHAFTGIRTKHHLDDKWPGEDSLSLLTDMATPLFIVAATVFRLVSGSRKPKDRLQKLLARRAPEYQSEDAVAMVYRSVLQAITANTRRDEIEGAWQDFQTVVGSIVSLAQPLSASALAHLLGLLLDDVDACLRPLHAVMQVPSDAESLVRPLHLSFGEYLTSPAARAEPFGVDEKQTHDMLWKRCLQLLSGKDGLRENLCNLDCPGILRSEISPVLLKERFSPALCYACEHWVYHWSMSSSSLRDDDEVHIFLKRHLLHWLEALSLLNRLPHAIKSISILQVKILQGSDSRHISQFLDDAQRFILANRYLSEVAPLQLYSSAIVFTPQNSVVRKICGRTPQWIRHGPKPVADWGPKVQRLEGHTDRITAVAFSPDGSRLASASGDKTVRVWDAGTGAEVQTLQGHTNWVAAVAFSPDGSRLASASRDKTVRVWDAGTGAEVQTLQGHTNWVMAVAFSPDGSRLASASRDKTVRVWDAGTGAEVQMLQGHTNSVTAVAFSPDGSRLASASWDKTVRVWDTNTGAKVQTLQGHTNWVTAVAFSPNGSRLASVSWDKTVRVWDAGTGAEVQMLQGHTNRVTAVAFSPDGSRLVSASDDETVRVWDAGTGAEVQTLQGHTNSVTAVAFSPDGSRLVSASDDETVQVWDAGTGAEVQTLQGHTDLVTAVAFSPDGSRLASASDDETVRVWDTGTGAEVQTLQGHTNSVTAVAFSPDGSRLASASWDKTVRVWDTGTGAEVQTLQGHTNSVTAVAFSPDGSRLASASWDETVRVWDTNTGAKVQTLQGHTNSVTAVAFSPDGSRLASASWDKTVRVWDTNTGAKVQTLQGHTNKVTAVAFSPDGSRLASASWDKTVRVWDTGTSLQTNKFEFTAVEQLNFAADSSTIITNRGHIKLDATQDKGAHNTTQNMLNLISGIGPEPREEGKDADNDLVELLVPIDKMTQHLKDKKDDLSSSSSHESSGVELAKTL